jgi:hypothetical protein
MAPVSQIYADPLAGLIELDRESVPEQMGRGRKSNWTAAHDRYRKFIEPCHLRSPSLISEISK